MFSYRCSLCRTQHHTPSSPPVAPRLLAPDQPGTDGWLAPQDTAPVQKGIGATTVIGQWTEAVAANRIVMSLAATHKRPALRQQPRLSTTAETRIAQVRSRYYTVGSAIHSTLHQRIDRNHAENWQASIAVCRYCAQKNDMDDDCLRGLPEWCWVCGHGGMFNCFTVASHVQSHSNGVQGSNTQSHTFGCEQCQVQ